MLGRVLDRVRCVDAPLTVVVATSDREIDDVIAAFAEQEGAAVFRGAADDLVARALTCTDAFNFESFVRISGDSPFIDWRMIDRLLESHIRTGADLTTNVKVRSYPSGASVEIVRACALRRLADETSDPQDREHLTRHFYAAPDRYSIVNHECADDRYAGVRLVVDTEDDLRRAEYIMSELNEPIEQASLDWVAELAKKHTAMPVGCELLSINRESGT